MRTINLIVVNYFAARGGLYVHFPNIRTYLLSLGILLYRGPPIH